eukprot:tig00001415_g8677.t1
MAPAGSIILGCWVPTALLAEDLPWKPQADEAYVQVDVEVLPTGKLGKITRHSGDPVASALECIDGANHLLLPGFVNAHTHSSEMWQRGNIAPLPLELWLEELYSIDIGVEHVYLAALGTAVETLLSGGTSVMDHISLVPGKEMESLRAAFKAYEEVGIRAFVGPLVYDEPISHGLPRTRVETFEPLAKVARVESPPAAGGAGGAGREGKGQEAVAEAEAALAGHGNPVGFCETGSEATGKVLALMERAVAELHRPERALNVAVAPTGIQLCSDALFRGLADLSSRHGLVRHVHFLETRIQRHRAAEKYGGRTAGQHLLEIGFLDERTTCAHSIWLQEADIECLARSGATAVHNPLSNLRLGSGVSPVLELVRRGVNVTFGCDGSASNDSQDMLEAIKMGTILHNLTRADYAEWLGPYDALRMACRGGARALALADGGVLGEGRLADVVLYDLTDLSMLPLGDPVGQLLLGRPAREVVRHVFVNGRHVVRKGAVLGCDVARLRRDLMARSELLTRRRPRATAGNARERHYRDVMGLPPLRQPCPCVNEEQQAHPFWSKKPPAAPADAP